VNRVTCEEAFRRLDDYLDRELGEEETRLIDEHLVICEACLREFTFERSVVDGVRRKLARADTPPSSLMARIGARLAGERSPEDGTSPPG
jgi:anti-sigma factor (TIGR02949 family)